VIVVVAILRAFRATVVVVPLPFHRASTLMFSKPRRTSHAIGRRVETASGGHAAALTNSLQHLSGPESERLIP
jgi:hypothetical protein